MIRQITKEQISECVQVIRTSFTVVAKKFGITEENAPRYVAYATTEERLQWQYDRKRPMIGYFSETGRIIGYYSIAELENGKCELNNLCVLPEHQCKGIGRMLVQDALMRAKSLGYHRMCIGIVEENTNLRQWYESLGFVHTGTKQFDFFPFTSGYLEKNLEETNESTD